MMFRKIVWWEGPHFGASFGCGQASPECQRVTTAERCTLRWRAAACLQERDASVQRVLYVDLLNLLALDAGAAGGPGERVRAALDASGKALCWVGWFLPPPLQPRATASVTCSCSAACSGMQLAGMQL